MAASSDPRLLWRHNSPKRITITIPHVIFDALVTRSNTEGRSMSNLAAYLLERSLLPQPSN